MAIGYTLVAWRIYSNIVGTLAIAIVAGGGLVYAVAGDESVITASDVRWAGEYGPADGSDRPKIVKAGGRYAYYYTLDRRESCRGEIVTTWTMHDAAAPAVVTTRRPAILLDVKQYADIKIDNEVPASVTRGRWSMKTVMVSHCALREHTDPIADFEIEVQ